MIQRQGRIILTNGAYICSYAAAVGKTEGEGPLKNEFDKVFTDTTAGQDSWERSESAIMREAVELCIKKGNKKREDVEVIFCGDLLDQCMGSAMAVRDMNIPTLGLYGACSTMSEALLMAGVYVSSGAAKSAIASAGSHFCSAERQFRFPLGYGGQRTPTSQRTVTGAGAVCVTDWPSHVAVRGVLPGRIVDMGVTDANNMGAAMAAAACDTLVSFFNDCDRAPEEFDVIATGDLGYVGSQMLYDLCAAQGLKLPASYTDCGLIIFDRDKQDVHAGGSGCGCGASVLCAHFLPKLQSGRYKRVLFCATGALLSPTSNQQGDSIPGICHAVWIENC